MAGEPVSGPEITSMIFEYWDVPEENLPKFFDWFEKYYYGSLTHCAGYAGMTVQTNNLAGAEKTFGVPESGHVTTFHPLIRQGGVRTDHQINFDVLLRNEYNVVAIQYMTAEADLSTLFGDYMKGFEAIRPNWRQEHPDLESAADVVEREFFTLLRNHWDVFWDVRTTRWNAGPQQP